MGGVREALEDQTMSMAKSASKLISDNLKYPDGSSVSCIISDTTIGGAPDVHQVSKWFHKNRIGAQGSLGYAEVYTGGGYKAVTADGLIEGPGAMEYDQDMPGYIDDIAKWLNDSVEHPCSFSNAYTNFETWQAMYRSYFNGGQIELPLKDSMDEIAELRERMSEKKLITTFGESNNEYDC